MSRLPARRPKLTPYQRLLRHPKWQPLRMAILARDGWACTKCRATHKPLHVHHEKYVWGKAPWEVPKRYLVTLCEDCHEKRHKKQRR